MKILFVITGLGVGGAERQVVSLAEKFVSVGHVVKIAYLTGSALLVPNSSRIDIVSLGLTNNPVSLFGALRNLAVLIKGFSPDVVHSHMFHANLLARLCRCFISMPRLVCTAHSTNEGGPLRMLAYRLTDTLADVFTNVSLRAVREFERRRAVPLGRMISVPNGIDVRRYAFNQGARLELRSQFSAVDDKIILAVGRFYDAKDYPNLIRAFSLLANSEKSTRLWIIGDGPLRAQLQLMVEKFGLVDKVLWFGVRHDVEKFMSACDVFVLSSKWEGFGLVVAEAMAAERIVVATDCGGVAEVLGDCGFLVPPESSEALSVKMKEAIGLPAEQMAALGGAARGRIVSNFSLDETVKKWAIIYGMK